MTCVPAPTGACAIPYDGGCTKSPSENPDATVGFIGLVVVGGSNDFEVSWEPVTQSPDPDVEMVYRLHDTVGGTLISKGKYNSFTLKSASGLRPWNVYDIWIRRIDNGLFGPWQFISVLTDGVPGYITDVHGNPITDVNGNPIYPVHGGPSGGVPRTGVTFNGQWVYFNGELITYRSS